MTSPAWPASTVVFSDHQDLSEIIAALHVNALQHEVLSLEQTLGRNPHLSDNPIYTPSTAGATVADRLIRLEHDVSSRLADLARESAVGLVSAYLGTPALIGSAVVNWTTLVFPQVDNSMLVNEISNTAVLYDAATGRFYPIAPDPSGWSLNATVTWTGDPGGAAVGRRGLQIIGSDGRVFAENRRPAVPGTTDDDHMSVSWTGLLPATGGYFLTVRAFNDSGQAVNIKADSNATPSRAYYTRIPG